MNHPATCEDRMTAQARLGEHDCIDEKIVLAYFVASLIFMAGAMFAGFLYSLQFLQLYLFPSIELFSPGRWRMIHTYGVSYGFIANAFIGAIHWIVPHLSRRSVWSVKLSWSIFVLWQLVVVATIAELMTGHAQAIAWGENPVWIDVIVQFGLILGAINFLYPISQIRGSKHVTLWHFFSAMSWIILIYAMGNFLPQFVVGGAAARSINGLYIYDLVGLFATPIGWGLVYYFVPIILNKPIWSQRLAVAGCWGLSCLYPMVGVCLFLYRPNSTVLKFSAMAATGAISLVVLSVIVNFFATMRHRAAAFWSSMPLRWFTLGMVFYVVVCVQSAWQSTLAVKTITHFTDWVVGHAHVAMLGVFGFWIFAMMTHLLPRLIGATGWWRPRLNAWHFWISGIGMLVMFCDLTFAGLMQGTMLRDLAPWESIVEASRPFWWVRTISGTMIMVGQLPFVWNIMMTAIHKGLEEPYESIQDESIQKESGQNESRARCVIV